MIRVVEDIFDEQECDNIERILLNETAWFYRDNIGGFNDVDHTQFGFTHRAIGHPKDSPLADFFANVTIAVADKAQLKIDKIYQSRAFLHTPSVKPHTKNNIHTDLDIEHNVCLYYVNDSDGDTILFNDDGSERFRYTPKRNTALVFDGSIKHCASTPSKLRMVINSDVNV